MYFAGADNTANDGTYSAYFYQYSGSGVYSVRAFAQGVSGQTQILRETRELQGDSSDDGYKGVIITHFPDSRSFCELMHDFLERLLHELLAFNSETNITALYFETYSKSKISIYMFVV